MAEPDMRKIIMMVETNNQEPSALKAARGNNGWNKKAKDERWCYFYNRSNHTRETFWKLHGKPAHMEGKPQFNSKARAKPRHTRASMLSLQISKHPGPVLPLQLLKIRCFPRNNWNYSTS